MDNIKKCMNKKPLSLNEVLEQGHLLEFDVVFHWSGIEQSQLYIGGTEEDGGAPFTGMVYELYQNDKLMSYANYKNGWLHGDMYDFYENGVIKSYAEMMDNSVKDKAYTYYPSGNIQKITEHKMRWMTKRTFYDEDGNITEEEKGIIPKSIRHLFDDA